MAPPNRSRYPSELYTLVVEIMVDVAAHSLNLGTKEGEHESDSSMVG